MAVKPEREYRNVETFKVKEDDDKQCRYIVEGYASTFEPYVLFTDEDGVDYTEVIDSRAFDSADMTDVIFLYDHEGRVYARQKNGTLELSIDEHGLKVRADLSSTEGSRQMYEEIKSGLIYQMSFAFTVAEDDYNKKTHTRSIKAIRKVYDVSAVSIPANPGTDISARSYFDGVIEAEKAERLLEQERQRQIKRINLMLEVTK